MNERKTNQSFILFYNETSIWSKDLIVGSPSPLMFEIVQVRTYIWLSVG